jgi:uncharacterized protein DUF5691
VRDAVLHEWLELVRDHARRIPPEHLPELLGHGRQCSKARPLIAEVGGARAQWLAEQNPEWTYLSREASGVVDPTAWETGSTAQRRGYLAGLRHRDPAAARALLTEQWSALAGPERADLLSTLATGLGPDDEALLESGLDDKRREVRAVATDLLVRLPGSAYEGRAIARARECVAVRGDHLAVRLPEACDQEMRRDGIAPRPPARTGERAWWLEEILARAPLSVWPSPAELLSRLPGNEFAVTIHRGLSRAAARYRDPVWAEALLAVSGAAAADVRDRDIVASLYPLLSPEEILARASRVLRTGAVNALGPLLEHVAGPWPLELSRMVLDGFAEFARRSRVRGDLYHLARLAALRLPVAAAPAARELAESLRAVQGVDHVPPDMLAATLTFRHDMTQEIVQ